MPKTLLVIITDRLSQIIEKGELIDRYYNPGGVFDDVHIMMTNDDQPDLKELQRTVGDAKLTIHNLPTGLRLLGTTLWRPFLLRRWAGKAVILANEIKPQMVRCYGNFLNAYAGARIKEKLGIPLYISLHTQPDETRANAAVDFKTQIFYALSKSIEKYSLKNADKVSCVYGSIKKYALSKGASTPVVAYNVINPQNIVRKKDYSCAGPLKILYVGRVIPAKNPENIIMALADQKAELTVIGTGTKIPAIKELVKELGIQSKVKFIQAMPNDEICRTMHAYDLFAGHSQYSEIPKTVLEASLCGLPILFNSRKGSQVPEFENDIVKLVDDSVAGYQAGINFFLSESNRKEYGLKATDYAVKNWEPEYAESIFSNIHKELINI
ncbi:glycosyltransferase [Maridesulfovibrio zosterae]|uniref:glycosyltransferase n=1 Tax=Maridesulfovibrio zosterae TaxID=82171 RepID=UPI0004115651|nr:glycosyltransferase [Maridesulfovibrio zosterae]